MNEKQKNKKLTFDYDGKIVIQVAPNQIRMPNSLYQHASFGVSLEKVIGTKDGPLKANLKDKLRSKEKEKDKDREREKNNPSSFKEQVK